MSDLTLLPPAKRLTIVSSLGSSADGDSLAGQNVNDFPAGALFWVKSQNRFYALKKNLNVLTIPDVGFYRNIVNGVGSSAVAGRFVAVQQMGQVTLAGGTVNVSGLDLSSASGFFLISLITPGGTPGFIHAAPSSIVQATFTSTSGSDTSTYGFTWVGDLSGF
jgi:hypothetical protein